MKKIFFFCSILCFALTACTNDADVITDNILSSIDRSARQLIKSNVSKEEFENNIVNNAWRIVSVGEINIEASNSNNYILFDDFEHRVSGSVAHDFYLLGNKLRNFVDDMAFEEPAFSNYTYNYDEPSGGVFVIKDDKESNSNFAYMYIDKLEEQDLYTITRLEFDAVPHYYYCHYVMMNDEELDTALKTHTYEIK